MMHLVYSALKARLTERTAPKYIDWYTGQYSEDEMADGGELLWDTPAQFIEFLPVDWKTLGANNVQCAVLGFAVHLCNHTFDTDDRRITDVTLGHFAKESAIFVALMNWRAMMSDVPGLEALAGTPNDRVLIESIVRTGTEPDHNIRRQMVSVQTFQTKIYDYSAEPQWQTVVASLQIEVLKVNAL